MGLICIGVIAIGGFLFLNRNQRAQQEVAAVVTEQPTLPPPTPTATHTPTASPTVTNTPLPTSTSTPVVGNGGQAASTGAEEGDQGLLPTEEPTLDPSEVTPTNTRVVRPSTFTPAPEDGTAIAAVPSTPDQSITSDPPAAVPDSGGVISQNNDQFLIWAGVGVLTLLIIGLVPLNVNRRSEK